MTSVLALFNGRLHIVLLISPIMRGPALAPEHCLGKSTNGCSSSVIRILAIRLPENSNIHTTASTYFEVPGGTARARLIRSKRVRSCHPDFATCGGELVYLVSLDYLVQRRR